MSNPNNPPPQGLDTPQIQWIVDNILFMKRRLNGGGGSGGSQDLQSVTTIGNATTNSIFATSFSGRTVEMNGAFPYVKLSDETASSILLATNPGTGIPSLNIISNNGSGNLLLVPASGMTGSFTQTFPSTSGTISLVETTNLQRVLTTGNTADKSALIVFNNITNAITAGGTISSTNTSSGNSIELDATGVNSAIRIGSPIGTLNLTAPVVGPKAITFPDQSGTVALMENLISSYVPYVGAAQNINLGGLFKVTGSIDPVAMTDLTTKAYVDSVAQGLSWKTFVRVASTVNLVGTYANGASGVGATFTLTATGVLTIDGVATVLNDRILLKDQTTQFQNGIYTVTTAGSVGVAAILTRATDSDTNTELVSAAVLTGTEGISNGNRGYIQTTIAPITVGTTALVWNLFLITILSPGTGIRITGNTIFARLSEGVSGGQAVIGGTGTDDTLTIQGTTSTSGRTGVSPAVTITTAGALATSGNTQQTHLNIPVSVLQTGGGGYTALQVAVSETSTGSGSKYLMNLLAGATGTASKFSVDNTGTVTLVNGADIVLGSGTGTRIGTGAAQKLGFFATTPVGQQTGNLITALSNLGLVLQGSIANSDLPAQTINAQTGTTYTFVLTDQNKLVTANNASAQTYTVPPNSSVAFPIGTHIDIIQKGTGKVTIAQGAGVTINSQAGNKAIAAQYVGVTLIKEATDTWYLIGNLIA
jgi:hypothetical protein